MPKCHAVCPFCDVSMRGDTLRRHINSKHSKESLEKIDLQTYIIPMQLQTRTVPQVKCVVCRAMISKKNIR